MEKLSSIFLLIFLSIGFCQVGLLEPYDYETFPYNFYEAVDRNYFRLHGPVETMTQKQFLFNPNADPAIVPLITTRTNYFISLRVYFNKQGDMIEMQGLDKHDKAWEKYIYGYDEKGRYTGYCVLVLNDPNSNEFRLRDKFERHFVSATEEQGIFRSGYSDREEKYRYYYDEQGRLVKSETYGGKDRPLPLIFQYTYKYENNLLIEIARKITDQENYNYSGRNGNDKPRMDWTFKYDEAGKLVGELTDGVIKVMHTYHLNGVLATTECFDEYCVSFYPGTDGIVRGKRIPSYSQFDEQGRLVKTEEGSSRTIYNYNDDSQIYQIYNEGATEETREHVYRYCEFSGHDFYGNWTKRRCVQRKTNDEKLSLEELQKRLDPFNGVLVTREFSYYPEVSE